MDNSKRNVHNSGPLGMLVKTGQIKKIDLAEGSQKDNFKHVGLEGLKAAGSYFKTESGIHFSEDELVFVDPKECEPWEYANRSEDELGNMDDLINSIQKNGQLQPALIRTHPDPHDGIRYQIIFGRRRYMACQALSVSLLAIKKNNLTLQEAIACQHAENKFRKNVSNYSNAILYKKLLEEKQFNNDSELAKMLGITRASLSELMSFTKIPGQIINKLPNIHDLPVYMATKIARTLTGEPKFFERMLEIASEIGKSINTPSKLDFAIRHVDKKLDVPRRTMKILDDNGNRLFTLKTDSKGTISIRFEKVLSERLNFEHVCSSLKKIVENEKKSSSN